MITGSVQYSQTLTQVATIYRANTYFENKVFELHQHVQCVMYIILLVGAFRIKFLWSVVEALVLC